MIRLISYVFYQNFVYMNVGGVNHRTVDMLKLDIFSSFYNSGSVGFFSGTLNRYMQ